MKFGTQEGLSPGHIALYGDPTPPPAKGHSPQFSAISVVAKMAGWIKMPLGRKAGIDPFDTVLNGDNAPPSPKRGQSPRS